MKTKKQNSTKKSTSLFGYALLVINLLVTGCSSELDREYYQNASQGYNQNNWNNYQTDSKLDYRFIVYEGIRYQLDEKGLIASVTNQNEVLKGSIVIPGKVIDSGKTYIVKNIGSEAFSSFTGLTSVTLPASVTTIGYRAFYNCSGLSVLPFGDRIATIGSEAYAGCTNVTSVKTGNNVIIGSYAFKNCKSLSTITLGSSNLIGSYAFSGCTKILKVQSSDRNPNIPGYGAFANVDYAKCILYVPAGSVSAYQRTYYWKSFKKIQGI